MQNINTKQYWDQRFASGDWEDKQGQQQTRLFAQAQVRLLPIASSFQGTILDFGCGLGDAIPVYRERYPRAKLIGTDISSEAIEKCRARYGQMAHFIAGDERDVPEVDAIIASNVFEHLSNDQLIAASLLSKCRDLFIVVPYEEVIVPGGEHINTYNRHSFAHLPVIRSRVFPSRGWSEFGRSLWIDVYLKNVVRPLLGRATRARKLQIMFHLSRHAASRGSQR